MIQLTGVCKTYQVAGQPLRVLRNITTRIPLGGYVAVMGPSGSGKSTLLSILGCLDRPTSGSYRLDSREVGDLEEAELSEIRRHKIGFVFQSFHLVSRLSAEENVALPMVLAGVPVEERKEQVAAALHSVGLAARSRHRPTELSGGECQRVAIARATVMKPRVLLADEPTGNLDSAAGSQVMELLEGMRANGLTLIVVTHDLTIGRRAETTIVLQDGRIDREIPGRELESGVRTGPPPGAPA